MFNVYRAYNCDLTFLIVPNCMSIYIKSPVYDQVLSVILKRIYLYVYIVITKNKIIELYTCWYICSTHIFNVPICVHALVFFYIWNCRNASFCYYSDIQCMFLFLSFSFLLSLEWYHSLAHYIHVSVIFTKKLAYAHLMRDS